MIIAGETYRLLHEVLITCYDIVELKNLCLILGINPQTILIRGENIDEAADRLISYCQRQGIEELLISNLQRDRSSHPLVKNLLELILSPMSQVPEAGREILRSVSSSAPQGVVTICFSDIEGYSSFTQRMDEQAAHELVKQHNNIIRHCISRYRGHEVKTLGDGFMIAFSSPADGVLCAVNIQCEFALWNAAHPRQPISVRIGLNTGLVISARGDYEGDAVNAAARISAKAKGGQVLVSDKVKLFCDDKLAISFIDIGQHPLKGLAKQFNLFAIDWHRRAED